MAVGHGSAAALLFDGYNLTGFSRSAHVEVMNDLLDGTVFGQTSRVRYPSLDHGRMTAEMFYDDTVNVGSYDVLKTKWGAQSPGVVAPAIISFFPQGWAVGNRLTTLYANEVSFNPVQVIDDLVKLTLNAESEEDGVDFGFSLHGLIAETTFPFTGSNVDNLAGTTNGGVGVVHCSAIAGAAPNITVKIQHSTNGSTWADLVTFTAITTANTSQRIEVAPGTAV